MSNTPKIHFNSLKQALLECAMNDYIITSNKLDYGESIHCYNGAIYYEDGCMIGRNINVARYLLNGMKWTHDALWYGIYKLDNEDKKRLECIHKSCHGLTLGFREKFALFIQDLDDKYK